MRILFLTTLYPYPCNDGAKIKTYNTLSVLSKTHSIDVVCFNEQAVTEQQRLAMNKVCRRAYAFSRKITASVYKFTTACRVVKSLLVPQPYVMYKYLDYEVVRFLKKQIGQEKYDIIYFDHLQMSIYSPYLKECEAWKLLDEHNCESMIVKRRIQKDGKLLKKLFYKLEYKKLLRFERNSLNQADRVLVLSEEDRKLLVKISNNSLLNQKIFQLPIMVQAHRRKIIEACRLQGGIINILFVGTLTWEPNNNGMIWFLKNVVPLLDSTRVNIFIAGKGASNKLRQLCDQFNNVSLEGYVENLEEYFDKCDFMVVPLFIGSGQRVKILEAFSRGFPVIATKIGAEGLEYRNEHSILIADTQEEFVEAIDKMYDNELYRRISEESYKIYEKYYSMEALAERIQDSVRM